MSTDNIAWASSVVAIVPDTVTRDTDDADQDAVIPHCDCCGSESDITPPGECCLVCRCDEHTRQLPRRPTDTMPGCGPLCRYHAEVV